MVNRPSAPERKGGPDYSLDAIHRAAAAGNVSYMGTHVEQAIENYGYTPADVCACLAALEKADFSHSERYSDNPKWHDVYKPVFRRSDGLKESLYIKLRLNRDCVVIELCSFHPPK